MEPAVKHGKIQQAQTGISVCRKLHDERFYDILNSFKTFLHILERFCICAADEAGDRLNNRMESSLSSPPGDVTLLESNPDVNWQYNRLTDMATDDSLQEPCSIGLGIWAPSLLSTEIGDGEHSASADGVTMDQAAPTSARDVRAFLMLHSCRVVAFSDVYNQFLMFFIIKYVGFNITRVVFYDVLHHLLHCFAF